MQNVTRYFVPGLLSAAICVCGYLWAREAVSSRIYQQKIQSLAADYSALAERYNNAVKQSAITELEVDEHSIAVLIKTVDGTLQRIETPYHPDREIFIDYIVGSGRIWIRRIFDQATPPEKALVIDPVWETVDWEDDALKYGKVIYRSLSPGIWSIQVSGNGSLTLEPSMKSTAHMLAAAPEVHSYAEIKLAMDREVRAITLYDIWAFCISPLTE